MLPDAPWYAYLVFVCLGYWVALLFVGVLFDWLFDTW